MTFNPALRFYTMDADQNPVLVGDDAIAWGFAMDGLDRKIARTELTPEVLVSTVFLGLDHGYNEEAPILYETMIFGGPHDQDQWRYSTKAAALQGHKYAVALARAALKEEKGK